MTGARSLEFYGLPGVGKSTIAAAAVAGLESAGWRVCTRERATQWLRALARRQRLGLRLRAFLQLCLHPVLLLDYLCRTRPVRTLHLRRYFTLFLKREVARGLVRSGQFDALVLDQWALQDIWSLLVGARRFPASLPGRLLQAAAPSIIICHVQAPIDDVALRLSSRTHGLSRLDGRSAESSRAALVACAGFTDSLASAARQRHELLVLDARCAPAEAAHRVVAHLQQQQTGQDGTNNRETTA